MLSRDSSAGELVLPGLAELPITFDWFAKCKGELLSRAQRGDLLAQRIASTRTVGIMLHHALMDADELVAWRDLLCLLCNHRHARVSRMSAVAHLAT